MEQVAVFILSLPGALQYAVVGALFGAVGGIIGYVVARQVSDDPDSGLARAISSAFIAVSIALCAVAIPALKDSYAGLMIVDTLEKENRVFRLIFRLHPEAKAEARAVFNGLVAQRAGRAEVSKTAAALGAKLVRTYFDRYLPTAPDEAIHRLLQRNAEALHELEDRPKYCVSYFMGTGQIPPSQVSADFIALESTIKADIIEGATTTPTPLAEPMSLETLGLILVNGYQKRGYALENIDKIGAVGTLPAPKGCQVAIEFSDVLADLDAETGPQVFKSLLAVK